MYFSHTNYSGVPIQYLWFYKIFSIIMVGESNRIRTVPEYGHSRYLRNHKSYKKMFNEYNIHNYKNSLKKYFLFLNYTKYC